MGAKKYVIMAVVSGLLAGVAVLGFLQQIWRSQTSSVPVYVAVEDISPGSSFDPESYELVKVPEVVAKAGVVQEGEQGLASYVLSNGLRRGGMLTFAALSPKVQSGSVAPGLPAEMRAIALASSAFLSPIPPLLPGDTVDVWISPEGASGEVRLAASGLVVRDAVRTAADFSAMGELTGDAIAATAGSIEVVVLQVSAEALKALASAEPGRLVIVACPSLVVDK